MRTGCTPTLPSRTALVLALSLAGLPLATARADVVIADPLVHNLPVDGCGSLNGHNDCGPAGQALAAERVCNYYHYPRSTAEPAVVPWRGSAYRYASVAGPEGQEQWGAFVPRYSDSRLTAVTCR